jgi:uncharacterized protein (UPF0276 family)
MEAGEQEKPSASERRLSLDEFAATIINKFAPDRFSEIFSLAKLAKHAYDLAEAMLKESELRHSCECQATNAALTAATSSTAT